MELFPPSGESVRDAYSVGFVRVRVRIRVTLRLAVYRQSVRLGDNPFETHDQIFF
jgi:hypothetical protein